MTQRDWMAWHDDYDIPGSALAQRLRAVQARIREALDHAPPGAIRVASMCAGQGRDLIGALSDHPRAGDVQARLVELDPRNADIARRSAADLGRGDLEVVTGDASLTDSYAGMVPAQIVLACGVFGNITDTDIRRTIGFCASMCAPGGTVVWTRGRWLNDMIPQICQWFADHDFELLWLSRPDVRWGVGAHRFAGQARPTPAGQRMFSFLGYDELRVARGT